MWTDLTTFKVRECDEVFGIEKTEFPVSIKGDEFN